MIDLIGVEIPRLRGRPRDDSERRGALLADVVAGVVAHLQGVRGAGLAQPLLAAALLAGAGAAAIPALRHWAGYDAALGAPRSTIRPEPRPENARLDLAAQGAAGELRWDAAADAPQALASAPMGWEAVLRDAAGAVGGPVRARSRAALGQLRAARTVSLLGAAQRSAEASASVAGAAFSQEASAAGLTPSALAKGLNALPRLISDLPAPDVTARNATPYQELLDTANDEARQAGTLGRRAPASLALGAALVAAGKAMLGVPGASLAARGLLAAGAAAFKRGFEQQAEARRRLTRARELAADVELLAGQKSQSQLALVCVDVLARGVSLDRCRGEAPPMTANVRAAVHRELSEQATWEEEGGRLLALDEAGRSAR